MPCYHPITAYRSTSGKNPATGKWGLSFSAAGGYTDLPVIIPCGQCIGCRLEKSRQWAVRCVHEASLYTNNCFITLTFDDAHLDPGLSLNKRDFVLFMKRLRKKYGDGIRFFHCGEYGSKFERPHHHACLFNFNFPDRELWSIRQGVRLYRSKSLEELWPYGFCTIGDVTFESAAYVARYVMKKITGKISAEHYAVWDEDLTYLGQREPEYITMSRRPGIGRDWFEKYKSDVYPRDLCIVTDKLKCKPPKYYDNIYDCQNPTEYVKIKLRRKTMAARSKDNTPDRLKVKESLALLRTAKLLRTID